MNATASPSLSGDTQRVLWQLDELQTLISDAVGRYDWPAVAAGLEVQGDLHAGAGTGLDRTSYARAVRLARNHALPGVQRLARKSSAAELRSKRRKGMEPM